VDPFEVLGVPARFAVDLAALEKTHRELSRALHPDRYTGAAPSERRDALNRAVAVNEAFRALRDPVRRAEALFRRAGLEVGETKEPKASPALLMDVMEQREALAEARAAKNAAQVRKLAAAIEAKAASVEAVLAKAFAADEPNGVAAMLPRLGELRFYRRFLEEVSAVDDELEGLS
jgi:molecular chaperone HscB